MRVRCVVVALAAACGAERLRLSKCLGPCATDADCPSSCQTCWGQVCDPCQGKRCSSATACGGDLCECSYSFCVLKAGPAKTPAPAPPPPPSPGMPACPGFEPYHPPAGAPPLAASSDGGCGCADPPCTGVTPSFNWVFTACKKPSPKCPGGDSGCACSAANFDGVSRVQLRYATAYQLEPGSGSGSSWQWTRVAGSSLNLDAGGGSKGTMVYDSSTGQNDFGSLPSEPQARSGGIVNSTSGGGGGWDLAFFPYSTQGIKPPGMVFAFSGRLKGAAWFMLNKAILDRGPGAPSCNSPYNCWAKGSAGEIDFLESPNLFGDYKQKDPQGIKGKLWATTYNSAGRCWGQNTMQGSYCPKTGFCVANPLVVGDDDMYGNYFTQGSGGPYGLHGYNWDDGQEHVWAAVIDFRGVHLYRDPQWPGLTSTSAANVLGSLSPNVAQGLSTGACGDPTVYQSAGDRARTCVVHLPSALLRINAAQWNAATQLVSNKAGAWEDRYSWPSISTVANYWKNGELQCNSEKWWSLFIDTVQPIAPPTVAGAVYTAQLLSKVEQELIVPGLNMQPSQYSSAGWSAVILRTDGKKQSVRHGGLDTACIPGINIAMKNCPYSGQSKWTPGLSEFAPTGMNVDLCGAGATGCCDDACDLTNYRNLLRLNRCEKLCTADQVIPALQLPGHNGCGFTMPACPHADVDAQCGQMGPYSYDASGGGSSRCVVHGFPCNATMCVLLLGPSNYPMH